jgi:TolB-like protein/tRNA A-37 threonylcarbamoyl transferase component Bud32/Tfp pilus assembly protein PilF
MDLTGRVLGHYRIAEEISRGGMGVVYRATDVRLNRDGALKVLPDDLMHDADRRRRFVQEAQAASALEHPHIAVIHEVDEVDGQTFIAMELIRGEKLSDQLARQRPSVARALEIAAEVASGLARAHEKQIVHRDLKPANVMITDEGHAKIIDFGIAKLIEPIAGAVGETVTGHNTDVGVILGTMTYMSPEQTRGDRVDHRSDIFSFGILLHEILAGQPPFQRKPGVETATAILHLPAPRLTAFGPSVATEAAADIQRIVDKCLAKDPADRYQGMKDLGVDLRAARRRLESTSQTAPAATNTPDARAKWLLPVAGVAVAIAVVAGVWLIRGPNRSGATAGASSTKPSIAVLYFDNTTGAPDLDWLRTGITDMVVTDLSQSPDIEVISTEHLYTVLSDLKRADDKVLSPDVVRQVAERTGVDHVIVGAYMKAGDSIRINLRLQEAKTGRIVTSERAEGPNAASIFAMIDDLSQKVRSRFRSLTAGPESAGGLLSSPAAVAERPLNMDRALGDVSTNSIEAYRYYAEGNSFHERNREAEAAEGFKKAVAIDPGFAMAYLKLAVTQGNLGHLAERDQNAKLAVDRVDRVTPRERYYILGYTYSLRPATISRAVESYEKCLEVDPAHMACRHNLALIYSNAERFAESIQHGEELRRRGSAIPITFANLSGAYIRLGQFDRARLVAEDLIRKSPEVAESYRGLAIVKLAEGQLDDAIAEVTKAERLGAPDANTPVARAVSEILAERWDRADATATSMINGADPTFRWFGALQKQAMSLFRGQSREALQWADRAVKAYPTPGVRSGIGHQVASNILLARSQAAQALLEAQLALRDGSAQGQQFAALFAIAWAQGALGQQREAEVTIGTIEALSTEVSRSRDIGRVQFVRGLVSLGLGNADAAIAS